MTAHELAAKLLAGPDLPVVAGIGLDNDIFEVCKCEQSETYSFNVSVESPLRVVPVIRLD